MDLVFSSMKAIARNSLGSHLSTTLITLVSDHNSEYLIFEDSEKTFHKTSKVLVGVSPDSGRMVGRSSSDILTKYYKGWTATITAKIQEQAETHIMLRELNRLHSLLCSLELPLPQQGCMILRIQKRSWNNFVIQAQRKLPLEAFWDNVYKISYKLPTKFWDCAGLDFRGYASTRFQNQP